MTLRTRFLLLLAFGVCLFGLTACEKNLHDNTRPPEAVSNEPVQNHRFDGGESDPYLRPGDSGGAKEGGESGGH